MTDARSAQHLEREISRLRAEGRPFAVATIVRTVDATCLIYTTAGALGLGFSCSLFPLFAL